MDYTRAPVAFQVRKVARYVRLYGPRRTLVKVQGQYHMRGGRRARNRPSRPGDARAHVGLIGCGNFAFSQIAYFLKRNVGPVIRGAMDRDRARAESIARHYRMHYATDQAARIINDPAIDLIYIASNHASHAEYAIDALSAGKCVHVEKPHVVDDDQLVRLCRAMYDSGGSLRVGFNRPDSRLGIAARTLVAAQEGPAMFNWFIAGHEIPLDHWYYRPEEGGRVLGNLCHWTDFVLQMVDDTQRFPIEIRPARAHRPDSDVAVSYVFADDSIAVITFSAKGHAFEGVRERLAVHRGELLLTLDDFKQLRANVRERRVRITLPFRNHGHEAAIMRSYQMSGRGQPPSGGAAVKYIWETGQLFLRTREALESGRVLVAEGFAPDCVLRRQTPPGGPLPRT